MYLTWHYSVCFKFARKKRFCISSLDKWLSVSCAKNGFTECARQSMPIYMKKTLWIVGIAVNVQQESDYIDYILNLNCSL